MTVATISLAAPAVVNWTAHGLITGDFFELQTTGVLNAPLVGNVGYYAVVLTADTLNVATSRSNALSAVLIATTTAGSGVQSAFSLSGVVVPTPTPSVLLGQSTLEVVSSTSQVDSSYYGVVVVVGEEAVQVTTSSLPSKLTVKGLVVGSEVRAYIGTDPHTSLELGGIESSSTEFSFVHYQSTLVGYVIIHALGYQSLRYNNFVYDESSVINVVQIVDRQYNNPV